MLYYMAKKSKRSSANKKRGTWKIVRFDTNNKPKKKTKSKSKKKTKGKKKSNVRCFSRINKQKKRYVTCVKRVSSTRSKQLRTKRGGTVLPLNFFGGEQHKNYSKNPDRCH
jgi:hypothetical protein